MKPKILRIIADWSADGSITEKYFSLVYAPLMNEADKIKGVWTLAFDITAMKKIEAQIQLNE